MVELLTARIAARIGQFTAGGCCGSPLRMGAWLAHARLVVMVMGLPLLLLDLGMGCAPQSESSTLRQEIDRLNARVNQLEAKDTAPSAASSQTEVPPPAAEPAAAERPGLLRERWQSVAYGMTFEQVDALLGRPQRTIDESPKTIWFYSYPDVGNGSVIFTQESGVTDWQAPPFGNWVWWP